MDVVSIVLWIVFVMLMLWFVIELVGNIVFEYAKWRGWIKEEETSTDEEEEGFLASAEEEY